MAAAVGAPVLLRQALALETLHLLIQGGRELIACRAGDVSRCGQPVPPLGYAVAQRGNGAAHLADRMAFQRTVGAHLACALIRRWVLAVGAPPFGCSLVHVCRGLVTV